MELSGVVCEGVVKFDEPGAVPDGTKVTVRIDEAPANIPTPPASTLGQRLSWLAGAITDMPADFAAEHDHYIHGTPRRRAKGSE